MRPPDVDTTFAFAGFFRCASHCRIRIWRTGTASTVIATELASNDGTSITNAAELVATAVVRAFDLDPSEITWIEHYSAHESYTDDRRSMLHIAEDRYDGVDFDRQDRRFLHPTWSPRTFAQVVSAITNSQRITE